MAGMLSELVDKQIPLPWQKDLWQKLNTRLQTGHMPHALLLKGPKGVGKMQFAMALVQRLLCLNPLDTHACGACKGCQLSQVGSHPDLAVVEPENTGKMIKVDQVRKVVDLVIKKPQMGGFRVVVLCPAEAMNVNASNALLKSLEEPGYDTVLILVSHQASGVSPTIRSRCQVLTFSIPERSESLIWLNGFTEDETRSSNLLNVACGAPVLALTLNQSDWLGERSIVLQQWLSVLQGRQDPIRTAEKWVQYPLSELVSWLLAWQVDLVRLVSGVPAAIVNQDLMQDLVAVRGMIQIHRLLAHYDYVLGIKSMLSRHANPNPQLLLEEMLLKWSQVRGG